MLNPHLFASDEQKTPPKGARRVKEEKKPGSAKSMESPAKTPEPVPRPEVTAAIFRRYLLQYRAEAAGGEMDPDALLTPESSKEMEYSYSNRGSDDGGYYDSSDDDEMMRLDGMMRPSNLSNIPSNLGLSSRLSRASSLASEDSAPWGGTSSGHLARMPSDLMERSRHSDESRAGSDAAIARGDKLTRSLNGSMRSVLLSPSGSTRSLHESMGGSFNASALQSDGITAAAARSSAAPLSEYADAISTAVVPDINPFEFSPAKPTG